MANIIKIKRALISVTNREGLIEFAKGLYTFGVEIVCTEGTARFLSDSGTPIVKVNEFIDFPEILDGRVKTLHPIIYAGILAKRDNPQHQAQLKEHKIKPIDMVIVNLYDFSSIAKDPSVPISKAVEQIDIGGPTLLRAAAKNFLYVTAVCDPADYPLIINEIKEYGGTTGKTRLILAKKVFELTGKYDQIIAEYLEKAKATLESAIATRYQISVDPKTFWKTG